ncbi:MAG: leucyl aminopeptidase [Betaproteobacteria bacterium]|nr:leucyl aminopeptidase [Rhodocyclaceae bacterium]MCA3142250.1 leucyl aminopeptidase [Rhodocyclaceae bacterium]MCE2897243.1 leucyl aminopeptidase [Betaproteobacteria bacterium]
MEHSLKSVTAPRARTACAILGAFEGGLLTPSARAVDEASGGQLAALARRGDLTGKAGSALVLQTPAGVAAERVVVAGLGKQGDLTLKGFRDALAAGLRAAGASAARDATLFALEWPVKDVATTSLAQHATQVAAETAYRFDRLKSRREDEARGLARVVLAAPERAGATLQAAAAQGAAIGAGVALARDLGNLPSNLCTPTYLAEEAQRLGKRHKLNVTVLDRRQMEKLGMGALLAVTRGSAEPARFIVLEYNGAPKKHKPVVLVGKGITFDTGGISLKPAGDMDEMKYDMSGAGSVLGTFEAVAGMKLPVNLVGLVPTCENMPSGTAVKPGDIVTSMSGQTIEILNTDAEGRLILCDALTYAERYDPAAVIDIATLTGACVIALGHVATGLFSNRDALAAELVAAGEAAWDRVWHMPLWDDYQEQLKSPFADMANIGGRPAGSVTAACFLSRYARKYPWAHLDIAGTAWKSGRDKGSTGRPVALLTRFVMGRAAR